MTDGIRHTPYHGGHTPTVHENCENPYCFICVGGLFLCSKCGLGEGSLTSECPEARQTFETSDAIYSGKLDFINHEWVETSSPHSPASYR